MKKTLFALFVGTTIFFSFSPEPPENDMAEKYGLNFGTPAIESISELSFGPDGILFLGDSQGAAIHALDTKDTEEKNTASEYDISGFDRKVAASLGTTADKVKIHDMAVNPVSKNIYFSVSTIDGKPVILRMKGEGLEMVPLTDVNFSSISLQDPVAKDAKDRRERPLREWAVSDLKYRDGKLYVSGLSNREFGSTFRSIPFPFTEEQDFASLEIYHVAHGSYETHAPIKTFEVVNIDNSDYLMASYTCTPLVLFPLNELQSGKHVKGRTVAELGWGNSPLDIVSYEKNGKKYFAMSNTNRPLMRIALEDLSKSREALTDPLPENEVTAGLNYDSLPMVQVLQLDMLDDTHMISLRRTAEGDLVLRSGSTEWM